MTDAQTRTVVFKDDAGNYCLVPQATLEEWWVAAEYKAQIDHLITEEHDVQGNMWHALFTAAPVIISGGVLVNRELNRGDGGGVPAVPLSPLLD
jgi:hypothetical protein